MRNLLWCLLLAGCAPDPLTPIRETPRPDLEGRDVHFVFERIGNPDRQQVSIGGDPLYYWSTSTPVTIYVRGKGVGGEGGGYSAVVTNRPAKVHLRCTLEIGTYNNRVEQANWGGSLGACAPWVKALTPQH